ncbi:MAG: hypothetical protein JWQ09_3617 [Segetibacter sp.]|nr:hypothetical protein [Segetibacter sp.]
MINTSTQSEKSPVSFKILVNEKTLSLIESKVTGRIILEAAHHLPVECYSLYQKLEGCDFERISLDEVVDLSKPGIERFITKEPEVFNYSVNEEPESTDKKSLTAIEILQLAAIDSTENYLVWVDGNSGETEYAFKPNATVKMVCTGMKFFSRPWVPLVDIEEYGKTCKLVPPARKYKLKIDKLYYEFGEPIVTAKELLSKAGKNPPEKYDLFKVLSSNPQPKKIGDLSASIDLREKCLVRFVTLPKEQQDGRGSRVSFSLPAEDIEFLESANVEWEAINQGNRWLILHNYPVPEGYNVSTVDAALLIPPSYPAAEIDMAYFFPSLQTLSGRPIPATSYQVIDNKQFQRWSRHRKPGDWRPGLDNVSTHLLLINNWFEKEVKK